MVSKQNKIFLRISNFFKKNLLADLFYARFTVSMALTKYPLLTAIIFTLLPIFFYYYVLHSTKFIYNFAS